MKRALLLGLLAWLAGVGTAAAQGVRLNDPLVVSPAELHRLSAPQYGFRYSTATSKDEQTYDGGKITDDVRDDGMQIIYGAPQSASAYYAVTGEYRTRNVKHRLDASPSTTTEDDRSRMNIAASGAFKIMDKLLIGATLGSNSLTSKDDDGGNKDSGYLNSDLGLAVKSETYDAGIVQHIARIVASGDDTIWAHAQDLHLRILTEHASAWTLLVRRGPQTTCCVPTTTHRLTYAVGYNRTLGDIEWSGVYRYAPAFKEDARFGKAYDISRHRVEFGGHYALTTGTQFGLSASYENGHDKNAAVEIPTALETVETADYKASAFGAAATVTVNMQ